MTLVALYLALLLGGVACFVLYYLAQYRIARLLRDRHPQQWKIIAEPEQGQASALRTWVRLQQVLRTAQPRLPELLQDAAITRWYRVWRVGLWLAWLCWFAALFLQWRAR
ncbi:hypothetical protein ASG87_04485 [Frateuria sp. Soil773]|uniref:hypothetical protein n=1 Tax=Frateuria sp. Soil773 TaxID=1736407 RepID=UPI0006FC7CB9|nr:hypothetical protein [Frateuria sp. Soil773]KRE89589.1 hypothetical protein ASG87_04485 [Frateuria sp. Soil773]